MRNLLAYDHDPRTHGTGNAHGRAGYFLDQSAPWIFLPMQNARAIALRDYETGRLVNPRCRDNSARLLRRSQSKAMNYPRLLAARDRLRRIITATVTLWR